VKYALIADLHSNLEALHAILGHASAQGAERYVFLGDLVGYGPNPGEVIDIARSMVNSGKAYAVLGNHDAAVCGRDCAQVMHDAARKVVEWTRARLKPRHLQWLMGLPLKIQVDRMTWVHASASRPEDWGYIQDSQLARLSLREAAADWVFSGHVHDPMLYYTCADQRVPGIRPCERRPIVLTPRRKWLAIVGSAGQPRDGLPGARYAIFDRDAYRYTSFCLRYDFPVTAAKIRLHGLPDRFARSVEGVLSAVPPGLMVP